MIAHKMGIAYNRSLRPYFHYGPLQRKMHKLTESQYIERRAALTKTAITWK